MNPLIFIKSSFLISNTYFEWINLKIIFKLNNHSTIHLIIAKI